MASYGDDQIIYDAIGNPLEYGDGMQFEWSHVRRLEKASNQSYNVSYKYDGAGIRTSKTVNGTTTDFITSGIQVLAQKTGDNVLVWQVD
jgi:YD repeat-containing protein